MGETKINGEESELLSIIADGHSFQDKSLLGKSRIAARSLKPEGGVRRLMLANATEIIGDIF